MMDLALKGDEIAFKEKAPGSKVTVLNIFLTLSLAASLSLPDAYTISGAMFAIIGLFYLLKRLLEQNSVLEPYFAGKLCFFFMAFAFICTSVQLWHHAPVSHYEMYIPFWWAPLTVLAIADGKIDRRFIWLGCFLGAVLACFLAFYQSIYLGVKRPYGFIGSPVTFGNNALLLGSIALAGRYDPPFNWPKPVWHALAYLGFLFGVTASLITQSKGGWLLIPVVAIWAIVEDFRCASRRGKLSISIFAFAIICALPFLPLNTAVSRISSATIGTVTWFQTGKFMEGSAAPRLELWNFGLTVWPEKPWLGHGRDGIVQLMHEKIAEKELNPRIERLTALHNEPLQLLVEQGVVGLFSWILMFVVSAFVFARAYSRHDRVQKILGQAGLVTVSASFIFGLTDMNLMLNANRQIFAFLVMTIATLIVADRKTVG